MSPRGDRTTAEVLVLMAAGTICLSLLFTGAAITILEVRNPNADTSQALAAVSSVMSVLLGLVVGYLTGRRHNGNN